MGLELVEEVLSMQTPISFHRPSSLHCEPHLLGQDVTSHGEVPDSLALVFQISKQKDRGLFEGIESRK